jgi:hypothetical protein
LGISASGTVVFHNTGTFVDNASGGVSWQVPITNAGLVQVNSSTLNLTGAYTQSDGETSLGNSTLDCACVLQGGSFTGNGTVSGSISNTGGNLEPGSADTPGLINISGTYTQGAAGFYTSNISGPAANQIGTVKISGATTLGGHAVLFNVGGYSPSNGTAFTIMTFKSKTGQFTAANSPWTVSYTPTTAVATFEGGTGQPAVTLTPAALSFDTLIGTTSKAKTITVKNVGTSQLTIIDVALSGTNPINFFQTNNCVVLNAGQSCTISVQFTPSGVANKSATLTITDNAGTTTQTVPLTGVGTYLNVVPNPISFPSQLLSTASAAKTITLTNTNPSASATITSVTITGPGASDFVQNSTCSVIPAKGTCTFTMTFTPAVLGKRTATLVIADNAGGSPQNIPISGLGTYVTLSPSPVSFGPVTVGNTAATTVTLTNQNPTTAVSVSAVSITGADKQDFTASSSSSCASVAANGGSCTITVNFTPTATGARTGVLSVQDSDPGSPQTDNLAGTGQ